MNILMVNPTHPDKPHISAVRAWRFSQELSRRGHRVVLLTVEPPKGMPSRSAGHDMHDWSTPLVMEIKANAPVERALPIPARKVRTAWDLVRHGGARYDWVRKANKIFTQEMPIRPDIVWCTFGQMEAVFAGYRIAKSLGVPWVLDIKDNWELYVPTGLRRFMAWRTRGASAITSNSMFTAEKVRKWQRRAATVVYSGVDEAFFRHTKASNPKGSFIINIIGGLYFEEHLRSLLQGIQSWVMQSEDEDRGNVRLHYLGGDERRFRVLAHNFAPNVETKVMGYLPFGELAAHCQEAAVNAYVGNRFTFHHKLLELLACNSPVMVCPAESDESRNLAREVGRDLLEVQDASAVAVMLAQIFKNRTEYHHQPREMKVSRRYGWPAQTEVLEKVLRKSTGLNR